MKKVIKGFSAIVGLLSVVFATTASTFWVYKPVAPKSLLNKWLSNRGSMVNTPHQKQLIGGYKLEWRLYSCS